MFIFKGAAWWLPGWLGRALPNIDIEGSKLDEQPGHEALVTSRLEGENDTMSDHGGGK
jgi:RND superfamily putative drug exporter